MVKSACCGSCRLLLTVRICNDQSEDDDDDDDDVAVVVAGLVVFTDRVLSSVGDE